MTKIVIDKETLKKWLEGFDHLIDGFFHIGDDGIYYHCEWGDDLELPFIEIIEE